MTMFSFIRHEVTDDWKNNLCQAPDSPLSEAGALGAIRLAERLKTSGQSYARIITSTMLRAKETAGPIASELGIPLIEMKTLEEIRRPTCIHRKSRDDRQVQRIVRDLYRNTRAENTIRIQDEELFTEFRERVRGLLRSLENLDGDTVVVTHGHVKRMGGGLIMNRGHLTGAMFDHLAQTIEIANGAITTFEFSRGRWRLHFGTSFGS